MVMSVAPIIQSIHKLIGIHKSLIDLSEQKTTIVTKGSIVKLQSILTQERQTVQMLNKTEKNRQQAVEEWCMRNHVPTDHMTMTHMLNVLDTGEERDLLEQTTTELTQLLTDLKQQEQLNQSLIQQSMQFVQLSLDMMQPTIKNMNYGNQNKNRSKRSVFDSQV